MIFDAKLEFIREFKIENQRGLHARAAAKFVKLAEKFSADLWVERADLVGSAPGDEPISGRSIMGLMMLAASPGTMLKLTAQGSDAEALLDAIGQLIAGRFDED